MKLLANNIDAANNPMLVLHYREVKLQKSIGSKKKHNQNIVICVVAYSSTNIQLINHVHDYLKDHILKS
jgi:hypothetical protein